MTHDPLFRALAIGAVPLSLLAVTLVGQGRAQTAAAPQTTQVSDKVELLFVQNALAGSFDGKTLTLTGVGPTIFFSDRPQRVTGKSAPRSSSVTGTRGRTTLPRIPRTQPSPSLVGRTSTALSSSLTGPNLKGSTLSYKVKVLQGKLPASFRESSLFIDIFGR
jgi:hypothetical protein